MTTDQRADEQSSVLFVTAVSIIESGSGQSIDDQTYLGLRQWRRHFDSVRFAGIALGVDESLSADHASSSGWVPVGDELDGASLLALPRSWKIRLFLRHIIPVGCRLRAEIKASRYVCCTLGSLVGDWGTLAAFIAYATRKPYAVHLDANPTNQARHGLQGASKKRRIRVLCEVPIMRMAHRFLISRSSVSLLQGQDVFDALRAPARRPVRVYDTHLTADDRIRPTQVEEKAQRILAGHPLTIVYAGRVIPIKGPDDWVATLTNALNMGLDIRATWFGEGQSRESAIHNVQAHGLSQRIEFPGSAPSRQHLLETLRSADIFLFCHLSQESPRCLLEALACGVPIVGYHSAYAEQLVADTGGGQFVSMSDVDGLSETLRVLDRDRRLLADLVRSAARAGEAFDESRVYRDRARFIKETITNI